MTFQIFGTEHLRRNPEQDVIDAIDELVDWQMTDSAAARKEDVRVEVARITKLSTWQLAAQMARYFWGLFTMYFRR